MAVFDFGVAAAVAPEVTARREVMIPEARIVVDDGEDIGLLVYKASLSCLCCLLIWSERQVYAMGDEHCIYILSP